jgi:predicted transcriptional regulator
MELLTEKHSKDISCVLSCYDRIIIEGTLPELSHARGITAYLYSNEVKIFDYVKFAEPLKDIIKQNTEQIAKANNIAIEFVRNTSIRKEDIIKEKLLQRGNAAGIIHILSAMEICASYQPWHDKRTGKTYLKPDTGKYLHYYFYFNDPELGYGFVRVPTWCPFRLQVYVNGHSLLAGKLHKAGIKYTMLDNAFDSISDISKAQALADEISPQELMQKLNELAWKYCPVYKQLGLHYHWFIKQAEYATDIAFKKQSCLQQIYSELIATAIHTVQPDNIATFLGQKLSPLYKGEMGNNYQIRITGSRIKHIMGKASIKMYDKFSKILRIETTINDVSFFKHYREVVHRDGSKSMKMARLKKNIFSLPLLKDNMHACNKRYMDFISAFDNKNAGVKRLQKITQPKEIENRKYKGLNFFSADDLKILKSIIRGEFTISGFRNKDLRNHIAFKSNKISRILKQLWSHGLIKKAQKSYKYYVTKLGKEAIIMAEKIKSLVIIPAFNY